MNRLSTRICMAAWIGWIAAGILLLPGAVHGQTLKLYADDMGGTAFAEIEYGWDLIPVPPDTEITVSTVDCGGLGFQVIGDLIGLSEWDFSCVPPGNPTASTTVPIVVEETCNAEACGYCPGGVCPGKLLTREDRNFTDPANWEITNAVSEREDRPGDVTIWLRAGAQREGKTGTLGQGESRFCYISDADETRTESPLWQFTHQDANGWYLQAGDSWTSDIFDCEQNVFNQVCGQSGILDRIWAAPCLDHSGTQSGQVLGEGIVTLPSGHRFDVLHVRTVAEFCVYTGSACFFKVDEVRTVVYLWVNPVFGTVVRLQSGQNENDLESWSSISETDIKFGLFPPLDIQVDPALTTSDSVTLTWDPGRVTDFVDGWKIYWGEESADLTPYPYDSDLLPSQVAFNGNSATISGLAPDTDYYFSLTAVSTYVDPSTNVPTRYESLRYPLQAGSSLGDRYPVEVAERTLADGPCSPTLEIEGLRVRLENGTIQLCWSPSADPCLDAYQIQAGTARDSDAAFQILPDSTTDVCWSPASGGLPTETYYLVTGVGNGEEGPWGHYGR